MSHGDFWQAESVKRNILKCKWVTACTCHWHDPGGGSNKPFQGARCVCILSQWRWSWSCCPPHLAQWTCQRSRSERASACSPDEAVQNVQCYPLHRRRECGTRAQLAAHPKQTRSLCVCWRLDQWSSSLGVFVSWLCERDVEIDELVLAHWELPNN